VSDAYASLKLLADVFRLDPGLIRHWRYRGWINAAGDREYVRVKGRLYHGEDVMRAERDTFNNSRSHRDRDYSHLAA
jgi:hypothetical protein